MLPDICEWYTEARVEAEEGIWTDGQHYLENARRIEEACRVYRLHTIIEAGCGTGWVPTALPTSLTYLAGVDKNPHMLARARAKSPGIPFLKCDLRDLRASFLSADLVCCFAVLKHFSLEDWPGVLERILSVGQYGLFTQHVLSDGRPRVDLGIEWHNIWPTYSDIVAAIEEAGHEILEWDDTHIDAPVGAPEVYITTRRIAA